jgi:hypothetical protein
VWISAVTGEGLDALRAEIARRLPSPAGPAGGRFDTPDTQPLDSHASVGP